MLARPARLAASDASSNPSGDTAGGGCAVLAASRALKLDLPLSSPRLRLNSRAILRCQYHEGEEETSTSSPADYGVDISRLNC
jgi:hypothetical protein